MGLVVTVLVNPVHTTADDACIMTNHKSCDPTFSTVQQRETVDGSEFSGRKGNTIAKRSAYTIIT